LSVTSDLGVMASFTSIGICDVITRRTSTNNVRFVATNRVYNERTEGSKAVFGAAFGDC